MSFFFACSYSSLNFALSASAVRASLAFCSTCLNFTAHASHIFCSVLPVMFEDARMRNSNISSFVFGTGKFLISDVRCSSDAAFASDIENSCKDADDFPPLIS